MSINIQCSGCGKAFKIKDELARRRLKCPSCGEIFVGHAAQPAAPQPKATNPTTATSVARNQSKPTIHSRPSPPSSPVPVQQHTRPRWPLYVGVGVVAMSLVAVMLFFVATWDRNRVPANTEVAAAPKPDFTSDPKPEVKPEPKPEFEPEPKPEPKPELEPEVTAEPNADATPEVKLDSNPEPKATKLDSKGDLDRIAEHLTHQMVLTGLFGAKKEETEALRREPWRKSIKESWLRRLANVDGPLELKLAHCLAITSFPYGVGEIENEYVQNVRAIFKVDLAIQAAVLETLAKAPDFPTQRLINEASKIAREKDLETDKLVEEWEIAYLKTITSENASKLIRLVDYVKTIKPEKLDEGCKAMTAQLGTVLRDNPEQLKALSVTSPASDALRGERGRVAELLREGGQARVATP